MYDIPPPSAPPPPEKVGGAKFTDLFIQRPVLSLVVSLLILLVGARALFELPVREYPKLSNTVITVQTSYPGATADLMQGFITQPLEQSVASAEGIDYLTSSSSQGSSTISVYVKLNVDPNKALTEVISKVQEVKYLIPKEAYDPVITKETGAQFATMYLSFASKTMANSAIADYISRAAQPKLATVAGVASAEIIGGQTFAMRMWLDPQRMAAYGVTAEDVNNAITNNNFQSAPGQVKGYFTITDVTADTGLTSVDQFRELVVKAKGDQLVRMRDIARVDLDAESFDAQIFMEGKSAVFVAIHVTPDGNPLDVAQGIRAITPEIQHNLPNGMEMEIQFDSTDFIRAAIKEVATTLIEALLIVIVIIFLFLGNLRAVVIPVVTIPLSLIGAGIVMAALGFSLNLLTLLAMVLAIGLVVDDAIVVVENVYRWMELGKTPIQAALIGAREIAGPVIVMTLTLAAVYAPIGFLGGLTGTLFREFAFTLAGSVIISGVVALTLSPMMCSVLLRHSSEQSWFARQLDRNFARVTALYSRILAFTLGHRGVVGFFAAAVLASAVFMFLNTKAELAPEEDQGIIFGIIKAPTYANIDYTAEAMKRIDTIYRSFPDVATDFIIAGAGTVHDGIAGGLLKPWDQRNISEKEILPKMQEAVTAGVPGVSTFLVSPPALPGSTGGLPIGFVISSTDDYRTIYAVMEDLKKAARQSGLFLVIDSDLAFDSPLVRLQVDHSKVSALGLSMQSVGDTLATMMGGNYVNRFSVNGRSYEVIPQVPRGARFSAEELGQYYVNSRNGQPIPLSSFVTIDHSTEPNALVRYNQLNSATLSLLAMPQVSMGQATAFLDDYAKNHLPAGFFHDYVSESRQFTREGSQLNVTFGFALIMIFLVLAAQFESLRDPLVVLVTVPLAISGALIPLFFWIVSFNIYTQVGLITLIGLISKHGILMVEFARDLQINEGLTRMEAIQRAAAVRLRPILMTTAAMVTGLLPLLIASGAGAASRLSIGIVIVFGMTIGTFFTLLVLPSVYTVLAKDHRADRGSVRTKEIAEVF